jgi:N-acetylglucosaminyldiphosphoundecaprenol N-acetyl-beta-D-mannosaminyltransferase
VSGPPVDLWPTDRTFEFGGVRLIDVDLPMAVQAIAAAASAGRSQGLHLCNAYTLTLAAREPSYRTVLGHPDAVNLPDGTPVAWYYRLAHGTAARGPVRGPSLMKAVLDGCDLRHFLLGGTPDVLRDLEGVIAERFPRARVVGRLAPPFAEPGEAEIAEFADTINRSGAQVVWVGLGTPRQDRVIAALVGRVDAVLIGVGAAFDFLSGHKAEAPEVLHSSGLEWAFRLAQEPRRLWRRYLIGNTLFVVHVVKQLTDGGRAVRDSALSDPQRAVDRVTVGGAAVHCVDEVTARDLVVKAAMGERDRPWLVVTPNIQHVALLESDTDLRAAYDRADLVLADGWPVVRAVRLLGRHRLQRITGADLFPALCREAADHGLRVGIVGGMGGAAVEAGRRLVHAFPGLEIGLTTEPPLGFDGDPHRSEQVVRQVRAAELDLLFLALGAPRQEIFAARHLEAMGAGVTLCVGAAVDFIAGRQRRAPHLMRRLGLEWAFRALHEPRRLLPRYARSAPVFLRAVARSRRQGTVRSQPPR